MNAQATPGAKTPVKSPILQPKPVVAAETSPSTWASTAAAQPNSGPGATSAFIEPGQRRAMIAEAAYYRAERRGFEPGCELEDWCLAEGEIDAMLMCGETSLASGVSD